MKLSNRLRQLLPYLIGVGACVCVVNLLILILYLIIGFDKGTAIYVGLVAFLVMLSCVLSGRVRSAPAKAK